jgi:glycosyltransferase involved in cell wall biosynthesis
MRVLMLSDFFPPSFGGVERVAAALAGCAQRRGTSIAVLTQRLDAGWPRQEVLDGCEVFRYDVDRRNTLTHYSSAARNARSLFATVLKKVEPHLIHGHLPFSSFFLLEKIRACGLPLVHTFYGPWHAEYLYESKRLAADGPLWKSALLPVWRPAMAAFMYRAQRKVLRASSRIITLSEYSRRSLRTFGVKASDPRVRIIPGGVDGSAFSPAEDVDGVRSKLGLPSDIPILFSLRRLVPRMGLEALVRAVCRMRERCGENILLLIGGEGPLAGRLRNLVGELRLEVSVRLLGRVPEDLLADYYRASDLFIVPTVAHENFGLPVLEAWACGTPVVAAAQGSLRELLEGRAPGYLLKEVTPEAIAEAVARLLRSSPPGENRKRWPALAREFDWERLAARYEALYEEALRG